MIPGTANVPRRAARRTSIFPRTDWGRCSVPDRDGYVAQVLIGTRVQTLIITGRRLTLSQLLAI